MLDGTRHTGSPFLPGADPLGPTTGVRMKMYAEHAPPLAATAAARALADSGLSADEITHVVPVTCTGFVAPGIDATLIRALGLRPDVQRVQVGYMGCHGAVNGLRTALAFAADPSADQIGAPESPLQAPAALPVGSAAQMRTVDAGSRTASVTLRSSPPDAQSPSRAAP